MSADLSLYSVQAVHRPAAPQLVPIGGWVAVLHEQALASADSLRIPLRRKLVAYFL
jgi:hypothetical protein